MRPGWSWRAHACKSPTHRDVCKVIRCPWLPSCSQLVLHDDTIADNLTFFFLNTAERGPKYAPSVPGPFLVSAATSHLESFPAQYRAGRCAQQPRVGAPRAPAGSRASPATRLQCHPAAIPGTMGDASRGSPVDLGALPLPLLRLKAALQARGAPTSLQCPEGRGAARSSDGAGL